MNPNLPMGTTDANMNVTPDGSFNFDLPIVCSPGTAGVQPNLSVSYNSNIPTGLFGKGFSLKGLSSISRTSKSLYFDNTKDRVNFNSSDVFMLDGQRLLSANATTYGQNGAMYETAVESFNKITSLGGNTFGPAYFTIQTPNGTIMEYGNAADAKLSDAGNGTTYFAWYINKVTDEHGNVMEYFYTHNLNGEILLDNIQYTKNGGSLNYYNKISIQSPLQALNSEISTINCLKVLISLVFMM